VLTDQQMLRLRAMILSNNPRQLGFDMSLWTRKMIRQLIHHNFKVVVSLVTVGRILKKMGMSPQRPLYRAWEQDPEKVRVWREETHPAIRAQAAKVGARIYFGDEASVRTDHHGGTTWGAVGRTPVVTTTGKRKSINMVSAVPPPGR